MHVWYNCAGAKLRFAPQAMHGVLLRGCGLSAWCNCAGLHLQKGRHGNYVWRCKMSVRGIQENEKGGSGGACKGTPGINSPPS